MTELNQTWRNGSEASGAGSSREFLVQDPDGYLLRFSQSLGQRNTS